MRADAAASSRSSSSSIIIIMISSTSSSSSSSSRRSLHFRGLASNRLLILRGGIPGSMENLPDT